MKLIYILITAILLTIFSENLYSQNNKIIIVNNTPSSGSTTSSKPKKNTTLYLDTAIYKITYKAYIRPDTANREIRKDGYSITLIGKKHSKFMDKSDYDFWVLRKKMVAQGKKSTQEIMTAAMNSIEPAIFKEEIITDYPEKESNNFQAYLGGSTKNYHDTTTRQEWIITDETMDYLGYTCRKAICHFRGRDWGAWFTEAIPMPYGPYNFRGLPGLIVELQDSNDEYKFTMIGIEKPSELFPVPIFLYNSKNIEKITRKEFRTLDKFYNFHMAESIFDNDVNNLISPEERERMKEELNYPRPYNPIELE